MKIELKNITIEEINKEYEKAFGTGNFKDRDDYKFTIRIAKDFPCFTITKDAPSWIIADLYEFVYDIFSNFNLKEKIENKDKALIRFLDYLDDLAIQGEEGIYTEVFSIWNMQCLTKEYMEKLSELFKPATMLKWLEYKNS